jgi:hypothetical protein
VEKAKPTITPDRRASAGGRAEGRGAAEAQADLGARIGDEALARQSGALLCLERRAGAEAWRCRPCMAETPAPKLADYRLFTDAGGRQPNAA